MAFPSSVVSLSNPTGSNHLNSPSHATQHTNANNEIALLETWGANSADYTAFTPSTLKQGSTTVTYSTAWARYKRFGKLFHIFLGLAVTSAGSSGQEMTLTLPSAWCNFAHVSTPPIGQGCVIDQGVKAYYALLHPISATDFRWISTETWTYVGNGPNWALASGDVLTANILVTMA